MKLTSSLKMATAVAATVCSIGLTAAEAAKAPSRVLIAYYSYSGNTRAAAKQIQEKTGGVLFEIKPRKEYPAKYKDCVAQAKKEINAGFTPPLAGEADLTPYDIVFLGSPNWWGTMAPPVHTFIKTHKLSGKTIIPFFTHGGGGMQKCESDMKKYCEAAEAAKILKAATYSGSSMHSPVPELAQWAEDSLKEAQTKK